MRGFPGSKVIFVRAPNRGTGDQAEGLCMSRAWRAINVCEDGGERTVSALGHARFVCDRVSVISSVHQPTTGNSVTAVEAAEIIDVRFVGTRG
jgi:hypothetical protein